MKKTRWQLYTTKEIKPRGWLRRQLEIQAQGLNGNLDKVWPDVRDSAWIGGSAESWERVPYWLDGFIPLAYLLEDEDMIARAKRYIDAILDRQQEDGWICPCTVEERKKYDTWAVQLIAKVLLVYYESSGDERVPDALYRALKNYYDLLKDGTISLFTWGKFRWFETFLAIRKLYDLYPEEWLLDLARILREQGQDFGELTERWKRPLNKWTLETHIVNLCMMLKSEALCADLLGEEYQGLADQWVDLLGEYNGTPVGLFTGDECLSGLSPIQGTELCSVVEQMFSYELLYAYTGDPKWAEKLEVLAFNALPATISDDMWTHQYVQQSNQMACITYPGRPIFRTNSAEAHRFGLEPHFGCCTANFGQGWPKLAQSTFFHREDAILSAVPLPSVLTTHIGGRPVTIETETLYPFENKVVYRISCDAETSFDFWIRVPSFAVSPVVNGKPVSAGEEAVFPIQGETTLEFSFETTPCLKDRPYNLKTVQCGSLVFSLPVAFETRKMEYERNGVPRTFPYCDYELIPQSDWNFGYWDQDFQVERGEVSQIPFSSQCPPVTLRAKVAPIDWGLEEGYEQLCAREPQSREPIGAAKEVRLVPYGCAKLRMTELPLIQK